MKIKVCGLRDVDNMRQVAALGVDYVGMILWQKSPRHVREEDLAMLSTLSLPEGTRRVGVFVDEEAATIVGYTNRLKLDVVQLHGKESVESIACLRNLLPTGVQIWKAVSIKDAGDMAVSDRYAGMVDAFVFDTKCQCVGGSGVQFDWSVLQDYHADVPFLLSGGIAPEDADRVKAFSHPRCMGIDINSRFETSPGMKDITRIKAFIERL